jgi:hypothetical protein
MQTQRFEKKYWISEAEASLVRDYLRSYLEPDDHEAATEDLTYPVHSIYLDSEDLTTYWTSINGDRNRFKLRFRFYHPDPDAPIFCEVKRRADKCVYKERFGVRREAISSLLEGDWPEPRELISKGPRQLAALGRFTELLEKIKAQPRVLVSYQREAWVTPENPALRVTLDRHVQAAAALRPRFDGVMQAPCLLFGGKVILEFKFADRVPDWLREMAETFNLVQRDSPKYCGAVDAIGRESLRGQQASREVSRVD